MGELQLACLHVPMIEAREAASYLSFPAKSIKTFYLLHFCFFHLMSTQEQGQIGEVEEGILSDICMEEPFQSQMCPGSTQGHSTQTWGH